MHAYLGIIDARSAGAPSRGREANSAQGERVVSLAFLPVYAHAPTIEELIAEPDEPAGGEQG